MHLLPRGERCGIGWRKGRGGERSVRLTMQTEAKPRIRFFVLLISGLLHKRGERGIER